MTELQRILAALTEPSVLATVVNVEGSAYRRPGARMLVRRDGSSIGTISGGCLESDIVERGFDLTAGGKPALIRYDSRGEEEQDDDWGFGLGCNGAVDVLLERIDPAHPPAYLTSLQRALDTRRSIVLATVFAPAGDVGVSIGDRVVVDQSRGDERMPAASGITAAAGEMLIDNQSVVQTITLPGGQAGVFFEVIHPPPHLLVCGAGHDALPLVRLAYETGWTVSVCDRRSALATSERFPLAAVYDVPPEETLDALPHPPDACVIMTHRFAEDQKLLRLLLDSSAAYVGVLGPRVRTDRLLRSIDRIDVPSSLHAPVGLDVGAETPEQIALAIIAEATAVLNRHAGGKLRDKGGPIHRMVASRRELLVPSPGTPREG